MKDSKPAKDKPVSKPSNDKYRDNFDRIFGKPGEDGSDFIEKGKFHKEEIAKMFGVPSEML